MSDMGLGNLSDEELAQLLFELENDPLKRAVNDYGQGSDFLGMSKEPTSWKRMGDKNDLLTDFFRTTKTYLPDWIPDMYPEIEDPGRFEGYRSDFAELYRGNPAYQQLELAMSEGATFDEAVQAVSKDPDFAPYIDRGGFRSSAEQYVSERAREGRELDSYEAALAEYEDFVNPRTGEDFAPNRLNPEEFQASLRKIEPTTGVAGFGNNIADQIMRGINANRGRTDPSTNRITSRTSSGTGGRSSLNIDSPNYDGRGRDPRTVTRSSGPSKQVGSMPSKPQRKLPYRDTAQRNELNRAYNKTASDVYNRAQQIKARQSAPSKREENLAKLAAYYNAIHYGQ